jgi:hypothetical protein
VFEVAHEFLDLAAQDARVERARSEWIVPHWSQQRHRRQATAAAISSAATVQKIRLSGIVSMGLVGYANGAETNRLRPAALPLDQRVAGVPATGTATGAVAAVVFFRAPDIASSSSLMPSCELTTDLASDSVAASGLWNA